MRGKSIPANQYNYCYFCVKMSGTNLCINHLKTLKISFFLFLIVLINPDLSAQKKEKGTDNVAREESEAQYINALSEKLIMNYKSSKTLFEQFIVKYPGIAAAYYELAEINVILGSKNEGIYNLKRAIELDPKNDWYSVSLAKLYNSARMFPEALKEYEKLSKANPNNAEYKLEIAEIYLNMDKNQDALKIFDELEKQRGANTEILLKKHRILIATQKYKEAQKEVEKLIKLNPAEATYYGMLGEIHQILGNKTEAIDNYKKVLAIDPMNPVINLSMADFYQREGDFDKAYQHLENAFKNPGVEIDNKVKILLSFLDHAKTSEKHRKEGAILLDMLLETHPEDPKSYSVKGDFCLNDHDLICAEKAFAKVLELDKSKYIFWDKVMQIQKDLGKWAELLKTSDEALEYFPTTPQVYFFKGLSLLRMKKYAEARENAVSGREITIENPALTSTFYGLLAIILGDQGKFDESEEEFNNAFRTQPKNPMVLNWHAFQLAIQNRDIDVAEKDIRLCTEIIRSNPEYELTMGFVYYRKGNTTEAEKYFSKALKNTENPRLFELMGDIFFYLNMQDKAVQNWKLAQSKGMTGQTISDKIINGKI